MMLADPCSLAHADELLQGYEEALAVFVSVCRHIAFGSGKTCTWAVQPFPCRLAYFTNFIVDYPYKKIQGA